MAAAAVSPTAPGSNSRLASPMLNLSFAPITIAASATTYATASGGLPFDLFAFLATIGPLEAPISYKDIVGFIGTSTIGYTAAQFAIGTPTSTTLPCTIRLWNGATESADAANSQTINGFLLIARNGSN